MTMALEGLKVIDVAQVAAVPMCARHLADFGANVIHIENAKTGDSWRNLQAGHGGGPAGIPSDIPYNWEAFNRNKKSVAVDLKTEGGRKIIYKLVEDADVFVTNLRLSERNKLGVRFEDLKKINDRLIYGSVTGHGLKGPQNDMPAYDTTVFWARSGVNHMLTVPGMSGPNPRPAFGDNVAGLGLAFGIMTALYARDRIGKGQEVEMSLLNTGIYQLTFDMAGTLATGQDLQEYVVESFEGPEEEKELRDKLKTEAQEALARLADFYKERMPNAMANNYETKDGRLIRFNGLQAERWWSKFCVLLGLEHLEHDPKFDTIDSRTENCRELYHIFKEAFLSKTLAEWTPLISGLPAAPVQNLVDIMSDPQVVANDFFLPYDHPNYGPMKIMASPINLSETPATIRNPAPEFSQNTEEVLMDYGYSWDEIEKFKEDGVIP